MTDLYSEPVSTEGSIPQAGFPPDPEHGRCARPRLSADRLEKLLVVLGQKWPRNKSKKLTGYRWRRCWSRWVAGLDVVAVGVVMMAMLGAGVGAAAIVLAPAVVVVVHLTFLFTLRSTIWVSSTDGLVMDALGKAALNLAGEQRSVRARSEGDQPVAPAPLRYASNTAARAAQRLFRRETGGWLTSTHAPAQGKDALLRAYALMSVHPVVTAASALDQAAVMARWRAFLVDAVGLVALGRSDLLVDLRIRVYGDLPYRSDQPSGAAFGPDAAEEQFLWPLRDRHSWDLIKDHGLPLLSAALSVVALLRTFG